MGCGILGYDLHSNHFTTISDMWVSLQERLEVFNLPHVEWTPCLNNDQKVSQKRTIESHL
jgi:hypothetical protein